MGANGESPPFLPSPIPSREPSSAPRKKQILTIEPPWQAVKEWIPDDEPDLNWFNQARPPSESEPDPFDQSPAWQPEEVPLGDGLTLVPEDS